MGFSTLKMGIGMKVSIWETNSMEKVQLFQCRKVLLEELIDVLRGFREWN